MQATRLSDSAEALLKQLKNPFDPKFVKCRVGATSKDKSKGIALFYLDSREVMKRLEEVCGIDGWQTRKKAVVSEGKILGVKCELSIRMPYLDQSGNSIWITKTDYGEPSNASPLKGASSDALKRAAVNFGIGRYLYYIPNQWYRLNQYKQFEEQPELPTWALPQENLENWEDVAILEYDPSNDIDLDNLDFTDTEAQQILEEGRKIREQSESQKEELIQALIQKNQNAGN